MTKGKVTILDYELGNLFSVKHACDFVGVDATISSDKKKLMESDAVILPGVGAFGEAMANMERLELIEPLMDFTASGKPFLGICLGLQLLFTESEEFGRQKGLDLVKGKIRKFPAIINGKKVRVPQIGWNKVCMPSKGSWTGSPLENIETGDFFYFVHSFYVVPENEKDILSVTDYESLLYCSGISKGNIFAVQYHPEKSGRKGINIYKTWAQQHQLI